MDVRVAPEPTVAPATPDRRELAREAEHDRPLPPAVVVELGRTPDSPGLYNARGVLEPKGPPLIKDPSGPLVAAEPRRMAPEVRAEAASTSAFTATDAAPVHTSATVQVMASASTEVAAALRAKQSPIMPSLHPQPSLTLLAGIQTVAAGALQQAERREGPAEHEEDPLRKEDESPPPHTGGKSRSSGARR
jgi:hypothetical protein